MYREGATARPAAGPTDTLRRDVWIEGSGSKDTAVEFGDDQPAVTGMPFEIKQIGDVAREQLGAGDRLILLVGGADDLPDRIVIG
jgi:hypothetical protein